MDEYEQDVASDPEVASDEVESDFEEMEINPCVKKGVDTSKKGVVDTTKKSKKNKSKRKR